MADPDAWGVVQRLLGAVRRTLDADAVLLVELGDQARVRATTGVPRRFGREVGTTTSLRTSPELAVLEGRLPATVARVDEDRTAYRLLPDAGAFGAVPVHLPDGTVFGALSWLDANPREADAVAEELFLRSMAEVLSGEIPIARATAGDAPRDLLALVAGGPGLRMAYQPIVRLADGRTVGVEALARFGTATSPPPDVWFARAARHGLGLQLERTAARRAARRWAELPSDVYLSVNASPDLVATGGLARVLDDLPADRLVIEITEHTAVRDYAVLLAALAPLRRRGVRVAIDDVGAGFASMRHVVQLRPDIIKLDASITRGCDQDRRSEAMAASLIEFAGRVDCSVVAEAIQTPDEFCALQGLDADHGQGYLFAAPGEPGDVRASYPIAVPEARRPEAAAEAVR